MGRFDLPHMLVVSLSLDNELKWLRAFLRAYCLHDIKTKSQKEATQMAVASVS